MSYRERATRKTRRAKTIMRLQREALRDVRFCDRWSIPDDRAWQWARLPDRTAASPVWGGAWR